MNRRNLLQRFMACGAALLSGCEVLRGGRRNNPRPLPKQVDDRLVFVESPEIQRLAIAKAMATERFQVQNVTDDWEFSVFRLANYTGCYWVHARIITNGKRFNDISATFNGAMVCVLLPFAEPVITNRNHNGS